MSTAAHFFVISLLLLFTLSCTCSTPASQPPDVDSLLRSQNYNLISEGQWFSASFPNSQFGQVNSRSDIEEAPLPRIITEISTKILWSEIFQRALDPSKKASSAAYAILTSYWGFFSNMLGMKASDWTILFLDTSIHSLYLASWTGIKIIFQLATVFTIPCLLFGFLCLYLSLIWKVMQWVYRWSAVRVGFWLMLMTFRLIKLLLMSCMSFLITRIETKQEWNKFKNECFVNERAVEGFVTITIPQSPPKNCVLNLAQRTSPTTLHHLGYATCVSLHNGENGLLTSHHLLTEVDDVCVQSFRNGQAMDIDERFKILFVDKRRDLVILAGPLGWESALACGSVPMITKNSLCQGPTRHFKNKAGIWSENNAKLIGDYQGEFITVLSNTEGGDSGAPYFIGKCVAGVHKGHTGIKEDNFNLASPIPNIPGLTTSRLVFETSVETSAPMGKIFREEEVKILRKAQKAVYRGAGKWQLVEDGVYLDDLVDSGTFVLESNKPSAPPLYPEVDLSGNGESSTVCLTNGLSEPTPKKLSVETPNELGGNITEALLTKLVAMVDPPALLEAAVEALVKADKPRRRRGKRGGKKQQKASEPILETSTPGPQKYKPPHQRKSQVSVTAAPFPSSTTPNRKEKRNGGAESRSSTLSWRPKSQGSAGQGSGQKQS
ncbi:TPA_asm: P1 protein [Foeniculum vulgare polerovirus]|nr:TPA_asm: P1 protein [Foeniculum vulgare polerovirus]